MSTARGSHRGATAALWVLVLPLAAAPGCYGGAVDGGGAAAQAATLAPAATSRPAVAERAAEGAGAAGAAVAPNDAPDPGVQEGLPAEPPSDVWHVVRTLPPDAPETVREPEPFPWYWAYDDERGWHLVPRDVLRTVQSGVPVTAAERP